MRRLLPLFALAAPARAGQTRWIAFGGGADPASNQVSLEQDLALAKKVLGPGGRVFFAGGPKSRAVQVLDRSPRGDPLVRRLGEFFDPRSGRDAHYEAVSIAAEGPATHEAVMQAIDEALAEGAGPLLIYGAGHGSRGATRAQAAFLLWGGGNLLPTDLAQALDAAPTRQTRVVLTSCYSGGFAEIAFEGANPDEGAAEGDRCGLFATTWDRVSSGCDPDPIRAHQQGYGIWFLHALAGQDRDGKPAAGLDLDGDGRVSLLEAHVHAEIAAESFDVPTTTSERWLRAEAPLEGPEAPVELPEFRAVTRVLGQRLGLDERGARQRLAALEKQAAELQDQRERAADEADAAWWKASGALLSRWPVLDDPYHPDFQATLAAHRDEIAAFLANSPEMRAWKKAQAKADALSARMDAVDLQSALAERLVRAWEDLHLAGRLKAVGGPKWATYQRLLACERSTP